VKQLDFAIDEIIDIPPAEYRPAQLPEHKGNPLIEALPDFVLAQEMATTFNRYPLYSDSERTLSITLRMLF